MKIILAKAEQMFVEWNCFWSKLNKYLCWIKLISIEVEQIFLLNEIVFGCFSYLSSSRAIQMIDPDLYAFFQSKAPYAISLLTKVLEISHHR